MTGDSDHFPFFYAHGRTDEIVADATCARRASSGEGHSPTRLALMLDIIKNMDRKWK